MNRHSRQFCLRHLCFVCRRVVHMEKKLFLLLVSDCHNLKRMNWLQDMSHKVVRIEGLTQESVAHMDAPGIPEQSHHDLRGADELTCHLWSISVGRKPKFPLRVIMQKPRLVPRENEPSSELFCALQHLRKFTTLPEPIFLLLEGQHMRDKVTFSRAVPHSSCQYREYRQQTLSRDRPHLGDLHFPSI
jgi:hypothetical protein